MIRLHLNVLQDQRKERKLDESDHEEMDHRRIDSKIRFWAYKVMIELLEIFDYIVFQLILHCKDMFSAAFMNKIKFLVWIILYILAMKSLWKIDVLLSIMDLILNYVICGNVENLPNEERFSSPKLQLDRNLESCNLIAWWMRNFIFGN